MFDTMTITKIAGGLFGAWLILLLGKWAGEEIYHAEAHGDQSYVIEVASADSGEPAEEIDMAALMEAADAGKGEGIFRKCSACHKVDGTDAVGPHLNGVVGRDIASVGGFSYSGGLSGKEGAWDPEKLSAFLTSPKGWAPGTTMGFAGLKKPEDRANVIAYLQSLGG
ncbi:cytochrome c family protein [Sulfitobacter sp. PR48]|uniref:c-type cytochrome n=1 Tax=unclassified Sulfitobacter TaxID=196795 RepID=UPI000DF39BB2|nr:MULTISPECIES: cytochrome c family protein [unclassified Sulfitobacter]MCZ4256381.1 cytochrome c family protein [Sulfitobacter sp. G21635-S1]MDD9719116.1 cytochrome c family protein [Sulfitobacter sp. PR48]GLT11876.1 cytochrome c [Sulfitobacter porphyrae]